MTGSETCFIGMDIHRNYVVVAGVNDQQAVTLKPQRIELNRLDKWLEDHLRPGDVVVMEATTNVWALYDLVSSHGVTVKVAHPYHVRLIANSLVKTDQHDALALARLLAANLIPEVWVPPQHVRQLRSLTTHRRHLVKQSTAAKNRLRGVLFRHNLTPPTGGLYTSANRKWWQALPVDPVEKLRIRHDLNTIDHLSGQIAEVEAELAHLSVSEPWMNEVPFLLQMVGLGLVSVMTILAAIGDISRFPASDQLVGYAGLGARVHASGQTFRSGGITKQGRVELRTMMIEVAWRAVQNSAVWHSRFEHLAHKHGRQKAITIVARRLLVAIWHILTNHALDHNINPIATYHSFLEWGSRHRLARSRGMKRREFADWASVQIGLSLESVTVA